MSGDFPDPKRDYNISSHLCATAQAICKLQISFHHAVIFDCPVWKLESNFESENELHKWKVPQQESPKTKEIVSALVWIRSPYIK